MKFSSYHFSILPSIILTITTIVIVTIFSSTITYAQTIPSVSSLNLIVSTDNPEPGQTITVTAKSYEVDINSSNIIWNVDGKVVQKGIGLNKFEITAPPVGKKIKLTVTAVNIHGQSLITSISIGGTSVDMITETDGYNPTIFKQKINPVFQNKVKIISIPHLTNSSGVEYDPKTLIYTWKKDGIVLDSLSGYGKQSISLIGDVVARSYSITVDVHSKDSITKGRGATFIDVREPTVELYANDPLYGPMLNKSLTTITHIGSEKELGILAVPFGFNKPRSSELSYTWLINGTERPELSSNQSLVLRSPDGSSGNSTIQLGISNVVNILQRASTNFSVIFNASESTSKNADVTF